MVVDQSTEAAGMRAEVITRLSAGRLPRPQPPTAAGVAPPQPVDLASDGGAVAGVRTPGVSTAAGVCTAAGVGGGCAGGAHGAPGAAARPAATGGAAAEPCVQHVACAQELEIYHFKSCIAA